MQESGSPRPGGSRDPSRESLSVFSVDEMVSYKRLYDSLAMLPPQRTWAIMSEIREAEVASAIADSLGAFDIGPLAAGEELAGDLRVAAEP